MDDAATTIMELGAYRIEGTLGQGGMGEVFLAWDRRLRRHVAIKRIRQDKADEPHRQRFRREAQAVARLNHPAIVQIHDVVKVRGDDCIVMEYVEGRGLDEIVADGPLAIGHALGLAQDVAEGLAEAHGKGLIHRDLKSANVRVTPDGRAKIVDFGIARQPSPLADATSDQVTASGALVGTFHAMSPEQASGRALDHRSDLFALGGLLYEMLTGHRPFQGTGRVDTLFRIHSEIPTPIRELRPEVPPEVEALVNRLLEKSPDQRPGDARRVAAELRQLASPAADSHPAVSSAADPMAELKTIVAAAPPAEEGSGAVLRVLVLAELVDPTRRAPELMARHDRTARGLLARFNGLEVEKSDGFLLLFERPAEAVGYALAYHQALTDLTPEEDAELRARVGIHFGEIFLRRKRPLDPPSIPPYDKGGRPHPSQPPAEVDRGARPLEVEGLAKSTAAQVAALAAGRQTLLTRTAFDLARHAAVAGPLADPQLRWLAHGSFVCAELAEPLEIFEVGREGFAPLAAPADTERAKRVPASGEEPTLGWRPAAGQPVPRHPHWELVDQLGEGGFGEVWLALHRSGEKRVFKFCFEAARVRALKREVTLFRLMKETLGHRPDIARILDWNFEEAPYFLEVEHTECGNLGQWAAARGGLAEVPIATRLELAAEVAEALSAAHSVGVLHKDVKPQNVLITHDREGRPRAVLTDFGVGLLSDPERLREAGFTLLGFTETATPTSSSGGTLGYLAPELIEGKPATVRTDLYALGVMLYQMVVGDLSRALAPGWRREVEDDLLAEDLASFVDGRPERRPASALEVAQRLRSLGPRRARREAERRAREEAAAARQALERAQRRRRLAAAYGAAVTLVALLVTVLAVVAVRARRDAENLARAAIVAKLLAEGQITQGNLLVVEARKPDETPTVVDSLHSALASPVETATLLGHTSPVYAASWSPDGSRVLTASQDQTARIWDAESGDTIATLQGHTDVVLGGSWSPDGSRVLTASRDRTARIWDAESGDTIATLMGHTDWVWAGSWSPDRSRVLTASSDQTARIWDAETGEAIATLQGHRGMVYVASWSPDGSRVVTASFDGTARIWNLETGEAIATLLGHTDGVSAGSWSPDGSRVLTASSDQTARIWNAENAESIVTLVGHTAPVHAGSWSPDGSRVLTVSYDKTARIWNPENGDNIATLVGHTDQVSAGSWSPDGSRVLTASSDQTARIWNPENGDTIVTLVGHMAMVSTASWSPDGRRVLTASWDQTARIWNPESGDNIVTLVGHMAMVSAASWSPAGRRVLTASDDKTARIWAVSDNYPDYLRGRIRARTRLCLEPEFHQQYLGESAAEAERRHHACEACVPLFFERLGDAPRRQWRRYEEAWGVYEECFFGRVRG